MESWTSDPRVAAEIAAAAIKDSKRGNLVGTPTFGTGSRQALITLSDGSALLLSDAKYYSPSGKDLQVNGVAPDTIVPKNSNRLDLNSEQSLQAPPPTRDRNDAELQLESAIQILKDARSALKKAA